MAIFRYLVRMVFVAFVCIGAYDELTHKKEAAAELIGHYHSFELGFTKLTGWKYHQKLKSDFWKKHAEDVVTYLAYAKFTIGVLALTTCSCFTGLLGLIYLVH